MSIIEPVTFKYDMRQEGWELAEDTGEASVFSPDQLKLVSLRKEGESDIGGEELLRRAKRKGANLGQRQAEHLLERQKGIPKEWQDYHLFFLGTVWICRNHFGRRCVPFLFWPGYCWELCSHWLDRDFDCHGRVVCSPSSC